MLSGRARILTQVCFIPKPVLFAAIQEIAGNTPYLGIEST